MEKELIGKGRISKVYKVNGDAIKTFPEDYPIAWIVYEVNLQNEIYQHTQLPVIKYRYEEGSRDIKMPFLDGIELTTRMIRDKYKGGLDDLIQLQLSIYQYKGLNLSNAHDDYPKRLMDSDLDDAIKKIALEAFQTIEKKDVLCHFDFHFSNIMYVNHQYIIIDWVNAKLANPILDVARTYVILKQYLKRSANKYLRNMAKHLEIERLSFEPAIKVMAALRMLEPDTKERMKVLDDLVFGQQK
ncbi:MAG: aminoglycoside phosphotransferase family protein [Acholeplasmataceae bacterium]